MYVSKYPIWYGLNFSCENQTPLILFALLIQDMYEQCAYLQLVLPPSRKEYNYGIRTG
jgi:hypothetical protein